jgi:hypothetical protein
MITMIITNSININININIDISKSPLTTATASSYPQQKRIRQTPHSASSHQYGQTWSSVSREFQAPRPKISRR